MHYQGFLVPRAVILSDEKARPCQAERIAKDPAGSIKGCQMAFGVGRPVITASEVPLPEMFRGILPGYSGAYMRRNLTPVRMTIPVAAT